MSKLVVISHIYRCANCLDDDGDVALDISAVHSLFEQQTGVIVNSHLAQEEEQLNFCSYEIGRLR